MEELSRSVHWTLLISLKLEGARDGSAWSSLVERARPNFFDAFC